MPTADVPYLESSFEQFMGCGKRILEIRATISDNQRTFGLCLGTMGLYIAGFVLKDTLIITSAPQPVVTAENRKVLNDVVVVLEGQKRVAATDDDYSSDLSVWIDKVIAWIKTLK